jgi:carboxylesterase
MPGAEAFSANGGANGVLLLHGYTGNPFSMRSLAERLAGSGFAIELPLLAGHGTALEDLVGLRWPDWLDSATRAFESLAARCERVLVVGMSMGGLLACWLAQHRDPVGIVLINPVAGPLPPALAEMVVEVAASGVEVAPSIGSDISVSGVEAPTYDGTPVAGLLSLLDASQEIGLTLSTISCPVLLFSSREDHVVPTVCGDLVAESVSGSCERIWLERSFHVATLDHDASEVESRTLDFARVILEGAFNA